MRIAYLAGAGIAGQLILGALVDLGYSLDRLQDVLARLAPATFLPTATPIQSPAGPATAVTLGVVQPVTPAALLDAMAKLPPDVAEPSTAALRLLFETAAATTGVAIDRLDPAAATGAAGLIVGAIAGLAALGVTRVHAAPIGLGNASGNPLAPSEDLGLGADRAATATLALLRDAVVAVSSARSLVTPVGAAIGAAIVAEYGTLPPIRLIGAGLGATPAADLPPCRLLIGTLAEAAVTAEADWVTVIECNLDDQNPQVFEHVFAALFAAGALDVAVTPIVMKKGRPAMQLTVIGRPADAEQLATIVLRETTTLGVRLQTMPRRILRRTVERVETPYGAIAVKVAWAGETPLKAAPEYEDCRRAALAHGVPLQRVIDAARAAWLTCRPV